MKINAINTINFTGKFRVPKADIHSLGHYTLLGLQREQQDLEDEFFVNGSKSRTEDKKYYYFDIKDQKDDKFKIVLECYGLNYKYKANPRRY